MLFWMLYLSMNFMKIFIVFVVFVVCVKFIFEYDVWNDVCVLCYKILVLYNLLIFIILV